MKKKYKVTNNKIRKHTTCMQTNNQKENTFYKCTENHTHGSRNVTLEKRIEIKPKLQT
jgi:hypothetical protein